MRQKFAGKIRKNPKKFPATQTSQNTEKHWWKTKPAVLKMSSAGLCALPNFLKRVFGGIGVL
jgi:hypothetical protein